jgi:peptide/nickel transport system ATP-binding protein
MTLLAIENLSISLPGPAGPIEILRDVSLTLERGRMLGIVGESGSGKTMTALAIMGLLPDAASLAGAIRFDGRDLVPLGEGSLCRLRGDRIGMIFQEPMTALNPVQTIAAQVAEPLVLHRGLRPREARQEALRLIERVRIPEARRRLDAYPHQLSGGMRQRVMIAMALACGPDLLIADEPTTALDVTVQARILDLLVELVEEARMALILVSHDLGVIAETVDDVVVMYGGTVVERAPVAALFRRRAHPYTQGLFAARPRLGGGASARLPSILGSVPSAAELPQGCRFAGRCRLTLPDCSAAPPPFAAVAPEHDAACIRLDEAASTEP